MGWIIANTNEAYDGETHELAGRTFTEAHRIAMRKKGK